MIKMTRWQDWAELVLGIWLAASPWVLQFADMELVAWNAWLTGAAVIILSLIELYLPKFWEELVSVLLGLWLVVSPFVLKFRADETVSWNAILVGLLIVAFAVWAMVRDEEFGKWWHDHVTG